MDTKEKRKQTGVKSWRKFAALWISILPDGLPSLANHPLRLLRLDALSFLPPSSFAPSTFARARPAHKSTFIGGSRMSLRTFFFVGLGSLRLLSLKRTTTYASRFVRREIDKLRSITSPGGGDCRRSGGRRFRRRREKCSYCTAFRSEQSFLLVGYKRSACTQCEVWSIIGCARQSRARGQCPFRGTRFPEKRADCSAEAIYVRAGYVRPCFLCVGGTFEGPGAPRPTHFWGPKLSEREATRAAEIYT